ncbi:flavodoxin [Weissella uvarum]|uniref:flavodoxin n=1 Tax=Weissella uvarum TaxID=1479233 RepID=UPI00195FE0B4|nr:flavodoxin [Weissella uvarum]MBM7617364.1 flavodoxin [Weissella uvarum]MCM0595749.1 flavodoxin [Weissella uvarum]
MTKNKNLIIYYSRTGNTKEIAELIQSMVGGDIIRIETQEPRPANYRKEVEQNQFEQGTDFLPELTTVIDNFDDYQNIFIGTPTWNMALPQAVLTFLRTYDFSGKLILPFNTNGGYGTGNTLNQIEGNINGAKMTSGFSVKGGEENKGILFTIEGIHKDGVSTKLDNWLKQNYK